MKKLALTAVLGASLLVSSSAFALTAMSDANMKAATGQAGVSITVDNVVIEQYVGSTSYTDESGTTGTAGSVVISDKHTVKNFLAMTSADDYDGDFGKAMGYTWDAATSNWTKTVDGVTTTVNGRSALTAGTWNKAAALSIDVGTCTVLQAGLNDNLSHLNLTAIATNAAADLGATMASLMAAGNTYDEAAAIIGAATNGNGATQDVVGVVIGLPTLLISTSADSYTVGVAKEDALNDGASFIKISKGASAMAILGGKVEIAAH